MFILMSMGIGFVFGTRIAPGWTWMQLFHGMMGTYLIASGTAALNQWYEREGDALMFRTQKRPIPSGRVSAPSALVFGILVALTGFLQLTFLVNPLTGGLAL